MLEFLVDNIFVVFAGNVFQQIIGIPMDTNYAPLLTDIFLYSYKAKFIQSLLSAGRKRLASQFNFTYNNSDFENYLGQMYPPELEIKDMTESNTSSFLDLLLSIVRDGQFLTSLYDKRDDFKFHITIFPFLNSNTHLPPPMAFHFIRYARACSSHECFILRAVRLTNKLLGKGYVKERLKSSVRKFYGGKGILSQQYEVPSPECYTKFWRKTIYSDTLHWPQFDPVTGLHLLTEFDYLPNCAMFPWNICYGCGMQTEDAYSSGHLVRSHFGTCMCSNVETNLSWTCLVFGLLSFEYPSVLLFCSRLEVFRLH